MLSALDFLSDCYVVRAFILSRHAFWTCVMIQTMMWPFFVSQVPYLNLKLMELRNTFTKTEKDYSRDLKGIVTMTPLLLVFFLIADITFLVISLVLGLIYLGVKLFRLDIELIFRMEQLVDALYRRLFGLTKINLEGFRRMRTSS